MDKETEQTEPLGPSLDKVRDGVVQLKKAGVSLLDLEGNDLVGKIIDLLLDCNLQRFNTFMEQMGYDSTILGYVLADAQVQGWKNGAILYLESLVNQAKWIIEKEGVSYNKLSDTSKSRAIGYLYCLPSERVIPTLLKTSMLYPDWHEQVPKGTRKVDWVLNVNENGLRAVLRNSLESDKLQILSEDQVKHLWEQYGWIKYLHHNERLGECRQAEPDGISTVAISYFNSPPAIELLAYDVLNAQEVGLNLKQLVADMLKVLPHRKGLEDLDYFDKDMKEPDRHIMLRKIFQGVPLL